MMEPWLVPALAQLLLLLRLSDGAPTPQPPLLTLETTPAVTVDPLDLLNLRPERTCSPESWPPAMRGIRGYPCPSPTINDPNRWQCIRGVDLCNGIPDCDGGEDENPTFCLFHVVEDEKLKALKRTVNQFLLGRAPSHTVDRKKDDYSDFDKALAELH